MKAGMTHHETEKTHEKKTAIKVKQDKRDERYLKQRGTQKRQKGKYHQNQNKK